MLESVIDKSQMRDKKNYKISFKSKRKWKKNTKEKVRIQAQFFR
jgi:hypothetical protein